MTDCSFVKPVVEESGLSWSCPRTTSAPAGEHEQADIKETRWRISGLRGAPTRNARPTLAKAACRPLLTTIGAAHVNLRGAESRPETLEAK